MSQIKKIRLVWCAALTFSALLWLAWLWWQYFVPLGMITYVYDLEHQSPFINNLWPPSRVSELTFINGQPAQTIIADPVHVDVLPTRDFKHATLEVWFQKDADQEFKAGLLHNADPWQVDIRDYVIMSQNGWQIGKAEFDLAKLKDQDKLKFLLVAPDVDRSKGVMVHKIRVTLDKFPFNLSAFKQRIKLRTGAVMAKEAE